jgi:hypothetical protein
MKYVRNIILSLIVGGLFGWALSTKLPTPAAAFSGTAAAVFMFAGITVSARMDRREDRERRSRNSEELG